MLREMFDAKAILPIANEPARIAPKEFQPQLNETTDETRTIYMPNHAVPFSLRRVRIFNGGSTKALVYTTAFDVQNRSLRDTCDSATCLFDLNRVIEGKRPLDDYIYCVSPSYRSNVFCAAPELLTILKIPENRRFAKSSLGKSVRLVPSD